MSATADTTNDLTLTVASTATPSDVAVKFVPMKAWTDIKSGAESFATLANAVAIPVTEGTGSDEGTWTATNADVMAAVKNSTDKEIKNGVLVIELKSRAVAENVNYYVINLTANANAANKVLDTLNTGYTRIMVKIDTPADTTAAGFTLTAGGAVPATAQWTTTSTDSFVYLDVNEASGFGFMSTGGTTAAAFGDASVFSAATGTTPNFTYAINGTPTLNADGYLYLTLTGSSD